MSREINSVGAAIEATAIALEQARAWIALTVEYATDQGTTVDGMAPGQVALLKRIDSALRGIKKYRP